MYLQTPPIAVQVTPVTYRQGWSISVKYDTKQSKLINGGIRQRSARERRPI
jgi:hypothetical protein